jgi:hypothetical protein
LQAVWFSVSGDLALDASRDFRDIGALKYNPVRIHNLCKLKIPRSGNIADIEGERAGELQAQLAYPK